MCHCVCVCVQDVDSFLYSTMGVCSLTTMIKTSTLSERSSDLDTIITTVSHWKVIVKVIGMVIIMTI